MLSLKLQKWLRRDEFAFDRQKYVGRIPRKYSIEFYPADGIFYAKINEVDGAMSFGDTKEEAVEMAYDALLTCLAIPREIAVDLKPKIDWEKKTITTKDCFKTVTA